MITILLALAFHTPEPLQCIVWGSSDCPACVSMMDDIRSLRLVGWPIGYELVSTYPEVAETWNIDAYPTLIICTGGVESARHVGRMPLVGLIKFMSENGIVPQKKEDKEGDDIDQRFLQKNRYRLGPGSCGMICAKHGSQWMLEEGKADPDDPNQRPAPDTPKVSTVPGHYVQRCTPDGCVRVFVPDLDPSVVSKEEIPKEVVKKKTVKAPRQDKVPSVPRKGPIIVKERTPFSWNGNQCL